ncbi:helicase-related protein [Roseococcus pinisoli]|uniref:DNA helicase n=1 Tax=Roseococcus pinisoli TaxID=2835040 RepID=A0ABS5Q889_9PROT|nr:helicase-related protein [Roseococcus pinisoli]MBS7809845.1 DNA helicase [Roseococcus pinisoli]
MFDARVKAILGPTNTGKTHLAMERMLAHSSGIIGFPLRLLARENYDRMVAQKGEANVALITGEEKIIPPEAKWFACTVEAMPLDRKVEFLAVDEIQLCADPDRGHIFTDRLLHARGLVETMFMGAETIRPLLQRLVPQVEIETRPRLSKLTYAGPVKLTRLPARSAVVAFSAQEVYAIAEAIRRRRGGCAVVMGRLSPRTRNAQVKMYQDREVDFLVATDAIGMGLNMDVDHVAFASLQKFDGNSPRALSAQEAAQIAGRAGRGMRDGTFGTTAECPPLSDDMVSKIEGHHFEPLQSLVWRNSDLDFSSVDALLDSLGAPSPQPGLTKGNDATDHITLSQLAREEAIRKLASSRSRVELLWEACQIPDFRKLADDTHTRLCARVFTNLAEDGVLPSDWIASQIASCTSTEGDLDTLMSRLSSIRVWAYIAARADWVRDAAVQQEAARAAEDAVSDALHERLTARFVDRRAAHLIRSLDNTEDELLSAVTRQGEVVVEGHKVGQVVGFEFHPEATEGGEEEKKLILRAARRALAQEIPRRLAALETSKAESLALTPEHRITWEGAEIARLKTGSEPGKPLIEINASEFLDSPQRERVRTRLAGWIEGIVTKDLAAIAAIEAKAAEDNTLRGPAFQLRETLGLKPGDTRNNTGHELRAKLKAIGIRAGRFALYVPEALKPRPMALRAQLWALSYDLPTPPLPAPGLVSIPADGVMALSWPEGFAPIMGWVSAGPVLLRLDVAERVAAELGYLTRRAPAALPPEILGRFGIKGEALEPVLAALGFRLIASEPLPEDMHGPVLPTMVAWARPAAPPRRQNQNHPNRGRGPNPRRAAQGQAPAAEGEAPAEGAEAPRRHEGPRRDRNRGPRDGQGAPRGPRPEGAATEAPRPEGGNRNEGGRNEGGRSEGGRNDGGQRRDGNRGQFAGKGGPRRDDRRNGPPRDRDRDRSGGPETRTFHEDRPATSAEDSPFAALMKLKLK